MSARIAAARIAALGLSALGGIGLATAVEVAASTTPASPPPSSAPAVDDGPCPAGTVDPIAVWPGAWFDDGRWWVPPLVAVAEARFEDECAWPIPQPAPHPAASPTTTTQIGTPDSGERPRPTSAPAVLPVTR